MQPLALGAGVLRGLHYHQHQADLWYVPAGGPRWGSPTCAAAAARRRPSRSSSTPPSRRPCSSRPAWRTATSPSSELDVIYWVTGEYDPSDEHGVAWNDPTLAIPWQIDAEPVVSERDAQNPGLDWELVPAFS